MDKLSTTNWHRQTWQRAISLVKAKLGGFAWRDPDGGWSYTDGLENHAIWLYPGESYDVMAAYRRAHTHSDPLLSPHGFFRALPHKQDRTALEFVDRFGPLDWPEEDSSKDERRGLYAYRFRLDDFWAKHLRYTHVLHLWEARDDERNLRSAFSDLYKNLRQIEFAEGWKLRDAASAGDLPADGYIQVGILDDAHFGPLQPLLEGRRLPWQRAQLPFEDWLRGTTFKELQESAIQIFHSELNAHRVEARWFRMDVDDPSQSIAFQLHFLGGNLWQRMWELAGLDTSRVKSWRICPSCNTIFYPKRSDQFYCTSKEQVLASKRNYIRARRQRERINKLLETDAGSGKHKPARKKRSTNK